MMTISQESLRVILMAFLIGIIIQWLLGLIIKRWFKDVKFDRFRINLEPLSAPVRLLMPALAVSVTLPLLQLSEKAQSTLEHLVQLWIMACLGWLLTKIVHITRETMLRRYEATTADFHGRRIYTQVRIIEHILNLLIWVLTLALMIMTFSQIKEVGVSIFASAGIMSVIIGFAAQKTLGNVIAGVQIAMSQPIRLEDVVIVEGEYGFVEEITLTYVVVRLWDLRRMVLPISYFIEKPFQNWTRTSTEMLGSIFLYADYTVPVDKVREELTRILKDNPRWGKKVNVLQVSNMKETTVELKALVNAIDSGTLTDLCNEVREKLLIFLQNNYPEALPRTRIDIERKKSPV